jgi:hypothetical protein
MVVAAVFRGDKAQKYQLMRAVEHNCTCAAGGCPAHRALCDQRWLDGLLFAQHWTERWLEEEFGVARRR